MEFTDNTNRYYFFLLAAIAIHVFDALSGFNRGPSFWIFFDIYMAYALFFYYLTLPEFNGHLYIYNLAFALIVSLISIYLPFLVIWGSQYISFLPSLLIFSPVWVLSIIFFVGQSNESLQMIGNIYIFAWSIFFIIYFFANMPTHQKNSFYENSFKINVAQNFQKTINFMRDTVVKAENHFSDSISNFVNQMTLTAMGGPDYTTNVTTNQSSKALKGIFIENVKPLISPFYESTPMIYYFTVEAKNLHQRESVLIHCWAQNGTKDNIMKYPGKVSLIGNSSHDSSHYLINGNQRYDFQCNLSNLKPGRYSFHVKVDYDAVFSSYMPMYIISLSEFLNLRQLNKNFYSFYHFDKPTTTTTFAPVFVALGFAHQPLIENTYSSFSLKIQKGWGDSSSNIVNISEVNISFPEQVDFKPPEYLVGTTNDASEAKSSSDKSSTVGKSSENENKKKSTNKAIVGNGLEYLKHIVSRDLGKRHVYSFTFFEGPYANPLLITLPVSVSSLDGKSVLKDVVEATISLDYQTSAQDDFKVVSLSGNS